jgi:excisionase family DNA binding protein
MSAVRIEVAARLLEVDGNTVRRMIDAGKLRCWRTPGGHRRLALSDVEAARRELHTPEKQTKVAVSA